MIFIGKLDNREIVKEDEVERDEDYLELNTLLLLRLLLRSELEAEAERGVIAFF